MLKETVGKQAQQAARESEQRSHSVLITLVLELQILKALSERRETAT